MAASASSDGGLRRVPLDAGHVIPGAAAPWSGGDAMEGDRFGSHAVRGPAPVMPANQVTLGYDKQQFPLLRAHIAEAAAAGNTERLLNALGVLDRSLSPATKVAEAAQAGVLDTLLELGSYDASDRAREVATKCVRTLLSHAAGRGCLTRCRDSPAVSRRVALLCKLTGDKSQRVRLSAIGALDSVASAPPGPVVLASSDGLVAAVAESVARESAGRSTAAAEAEATALSCLGRCAQSPDREGIVQCLACDVPVVAVTALARGRGRSTAEAARLLTALATSAHGKRAVLAAGATMSAVEAAASLAAQQSTRAHRPGMDSADVRAASLAAVLALLGTLCIDAGAKRDALRGGAVATVVSVLASARDHAVLLQCCRAVEVLTALPDARAELLAAGADRALLDVRDAPRVRDAVMRAASDAHQAVTWTP
ncbi:hypothetical protein FNF29_07486 [Cafeteria roenbergensis]|uniref:Armadillo repeat-containing protein 8 n=1 Tax=Cafeteria roenbergensis TaxID=33653 RepID=A0A5A8C357_CAFRO|nr:hypothetical protein FNF29_07486 [Cafeteria roenbergensis]|mmetsp:Transcript_9264/g.36207  ORF Transcript_9264/g.36207 Transcript_9264/m.36207 type:complete len:426 (-) Transcript_9264:253-1530(-)|eukprot:KAA0147225.1 hypothetical protein FNF29_07486 [Cafeteria roenbergensis]